jgi:Holliday junction resolvase
MDLEHKVINSRRKGKNGELAFVKLLEEHGFEARRGQQFRGGNDSPDILCDLPFHFEVKNTQRLQLEAAYTQAVADCLPGKAPIVAHKRNRGKWLVTLSAADFLALLKKVPEYTLTK